jgi:hypothetical protein
MPKDLFEPGVPLNGIQRRYCSCLISVRHKYKSKKKGPNPYAICTNSVYGSKGLTRKKAVGCEFGYNYNKMDKESLQELAAEKKLISPKEKRVSKNKLIYKLSERRQLYKNKMYKQLKSQLDNLQKK